MLGGGFGPALRSGLRRGDNAFCEVCNAVCHEVQGDYVRLKSYNTAQSVFTERCFLHTCNTILP